MPGAFAKTKKATNILRPAIDVTFDKDAEFEVFSDSRRFFHGFFLEKVTLYGEKSFFRFFFFFTKFEGAPKKFSFAPKKDTSIAGLRMFVAELSEQWSLSLVFG